MSKVKFILSHLYLLNYKKFKKRIFYQILPGLCIGSLKDSQDRSQIEKQHITHIVSIHEDAKENPAFKVIIF